MPNSLFIRHAPGRSFTTGQRHAFGDDIGGIGAALGPRLGPPGRRIARRLALDLAAQLGAEQYDGRRQPEPHQQNHDDAGRAGLIVAATFCRWIEKATEPIS
jgi:hypothetical protein